MMMTPIFKTIFFTFSLFQLSQGRLSSSLLNAPTSTNVSDKKLEHRALATDMELSDSSCAMTAFQALTTEIASFAGKISTDEGEWNEYISIAQGATTIRNYINNVNYDLWSDGEDQHSWSCVMGAAAKASQETDPTQAVVDILQGFNCVSDPSHNSDFWSALDRITHEYVVCNSSGCTLACF